MRVNKKVEVTLSGAKFLFIMLLMNLLLWR